MSPLILLVDDGALIRKVFRIALAGEGYRVIEAADGRTALEMAREHHPDLIVQDIGLPDMHGSDLARELRGMIGSTPILAVSGSLTPGEEANLSAAGFSDFLAKPVELPQLVEAVAKHLPQPRRESAPA